MDKYTTIVFRADASQKIGIGHVMRCLTLADGLAVHGAKVRFICRQQPGDMISYIQGKGYDVVTWMQTDEEIVEYLDTINQSIDWFIVDHYELDVSWERLLRPYVKKIMVIDDLANRPHHCDLLLDQNYYLDSLQRYGELLRSPCVTLLGPQYALLRNEFSILGQNLRERTGCVKRILVFFGGSDPTGDTLKTLKALERIKKSYIEVDVIVGQSNSQLEEIKATCNKLPNTKFHCQIDYMAQLMGQADLAIGAGGTATWERCYLGLPSLVTIVADNQEIVTEAVAHYGAIINMGRSDQVDIETLSLFIKKMMSSPNLMKKLNQKSLELMGNYSMSGVELVIQKMEEIHVTI